MELQHQRGSASWQELRHMGLAGRWQGLLDCTGNARLLCRLYSAVSSHYSKVASTLSQTRNATGGRHSRVLGLKAGVQPWSEIAIYCEVVFPSAPALLNPTSYTGDREDRKACAEHLPIWGQPELLHRRCVPPSIISESMTQSTTLSAGLPFLRC